MTIEKDEAAVLLRIPRQLHAELKNQAKLERRSLNSQVTVYVEDGLSKDREARPEPAKVPA